MKKTLALALVLVMVISSVCVLFASAEVPTTESPFFVVAFDNNTLEGAGVIFTEEDTAGAYWLHVSLKPVEGAANTYEVVEIVNGATGDNAGKGTKLEVPEGGIVYGLNVGNNYPELAKTDKQHEGKPNYINDQCNKMIADVAKWAVGDQITIKGVDIANKTVPTTTSDKKWYDADYVCTATYAKYDPNAAGESTGPQQPTTVEEKITVDGKLDDTGWTKAEWKTVNAETGTQQTQATKKDGDQTVLDTDPANMAKVSIGDLEYQFAVRADADNVYVAVKVNALPNNCKEADKMDDKVSSGTHFRFYVTPDTDVAAYGKDGAMAVLDTLLDILVENDGSLGIYKSKELTTDATAVLTKTETDSVYEISFKKSLFNIGETFRMATSYSDCHFGTEKNSYNVLNDHKYDVLSQGTEAPWSTNTKYAKYTVADLALGTYTVEPEPEKPDPSKELEEELAGKVTAVENPDFKVDLTSEVTKNEDGKFILTVVMKLVDIKDGVSLNTFNANLHYDLAKMTLLNERIGDPEKDPDGTNFGKVVVDCCGGYDKEAGWKTLPDINWDNLTINHDVDALTASLDSPDGIKVVPTDTINIKLATVSTRGDGLLTKDNADKLELTFTFELKDEQFGGVYVDSEGVSAGFLNAAGQTTNYKGQGDSTVAAYAAPAEESSSSSSSAATSSTTPSKPGDAGILIFAVLGIVAIAGAVTVIKVRR